VPALPGAELGITSDGFFALESGRSASRSSAAATSPANWRAHSTSSAAEVELFIRKDRVLTHFDVMLGKSLMREMHAQGITIHEHVVPASCARNRPQDLVAAGRPRVFGLRLRAVGHGAFRQRGGLALSRRSALDDQ
jgi:hypothetical protein